VPHPEPWLISYSLLGLVPVLMPLVARHGTSAGITFATFSLLGVFAPVLGSWPIALAGTLTC
jgi:hypothetical protein